MKSAILILVVLVTVAAAANIGRKQKGSDRPINNKKPGESGSSQSQGGSSQSESGSNEKGESGSSQSKSGSSQSESGSNEKGESGSGQSQSESSESQSGSNEQGKDCDNFGGACRKRCRSNEESMGYGLCSEKRQQCCTPVGSDSSKSSESEEGSMSGDPHTTMFDGEEFSFQGICSYVIAQDCGDMEPIFKVIVTNDEGLFYGKQVARVGKVTLEVTDWKIELLKEKNVKVNGESLSHPVHHTLPPAIQIEETDDAVTVSLASQLTVRWDGVKKVIVDVASAWKGNVCGLLGTADGNLHDEMVMPNGEKAADTAEFVESWKVPGSCRK
ncbi:BMP-binding endothelial regulator protein-like [Ptychodera flava]|uniref:BMP-binding endothelial regulator protein-like n=1 Tax=Ptychodera flava TaxID=63121 RepID=UPI00396A24C4